MKSSPIHQSFNDRTHYNDEKSYGTESLLLSRLLVGVNRSVVIYSVVVILLTLPLPVSATTVSHHHPSIRRSRAWSKFFLGLLFANKSEFVFLLKCYSCYGYYV